MGKIETKLDIKEKKGNCKINSDIICPICNKVLNENTTYNQLNNHLKNCDFNLRDAQSERIKENSNIRKNLSNNNPNLKKINEMIDDNYLNNVRIQSKNNNSINSEPHRKTHKKSIDSSGISDGNTINDFQLVIDYNNTKNPDLYEEKLKNDGNKNQIIDKYSQLSLFLMNKKNLMNYDLKIECKNYKEIFSSIKNCNIYYNTKFILFKKSNSNEISSKKPKILNLNTVLNKYFDFMIKNKNYNIINDTIYFSLNNKKIDYEMIGIIISILFIYPEIKLKYKLSLLLCKLLVNQRLELNDIKNFDNELYNYLYNLSIDKNINNKGLVYYYEGNELLIDGKNIKVNNKNVLDYIDKLLNFKIRKYKNEINIIKINLFQFIPKKYVFYFNGEEIYRIINRTL